MVKVKGQARVPNGVKDIVSKISFFFHIYIYIGLIILFNYAKQGMPFFRDLEPWLSLSRANFIIYLFLKEKKKKKKEWTRVLGGWPGRPGVLSDVALSLSVARLGVSTGVWISLMGGNRPQRVKVFPEMVFISFFSASGRARFSTLRKSDVLALMRV